MGRRGCAEDVHLGKQMTRGATILAITWNGAGNFPPERSLIHALVERGNTVHVLAHDSLSEKIRLDGATFVPLRSAPQFDPTERIPPDKEFALTFENVWLAKGYAADVASAIDRLRPDLLLVDASLAYAMVAAIRSGLPIVVMWSTTYSLFCGGPFRELLDSRMNEINRFARELGVDPFPSYQSLLESSARVLVFSYRQFDPVDELAPHILHVGPLRWLPQQATAWQRRHPDRPFVLVGLSTSYQAQTGLLSKLCEALAQLEIEAVVTTGPAISPDSIVAGANMSVLSFVSHDVLLPEADLLITHAGHGTVMAGVAYGVPMLCFPMGRDQPFVASRVVDLGMGRLLSPQASVPEIRDAITVALKDTEMRKNTAAFAKSLTSHPGLEQAVTAIDDLL